MKFKVGTNVVVRLNGAFSWNYGSFETACVYDIDLNEIEVSTFPPNTIFKIVEVGTDVMRIVPSAKDYYACDDPIFGDNEGDCTSWVEKGILYPVVIFKKEKKEENVK